MGPRPEEPHLAPYVLALCLGLRDERPEVTGAYMCTSRPRPRPPLIPETSLFLFTSLSPSPSLSYHLYFVSRRCRLVAFPCVYKLPSLGLFFWFWCLPGRGLGSRGVRGGVGRGARRESGTRCGAAHHSRKGNPLPLSKCLRGALEVAMEHGHWGNLRYARLSCPLSIFLPLSFFLSFSLPPFSLSLPLFICFFSALQKLFAPSPRPPPGASAPSVVYGRSGRSSPREARPPVSRGGSKRRPWRWPASEAALAAARAVARRAARERAAAGRATKRTQAGARTARISSAGKRARRAWRKGRPWMTCLWKALKKKW